MEHTYQTPLSFNFQAAQGDVLCIRIDKLPDDAKELMPDGRDWIISHSETGHHHTIGVAPGVVKLFQSSDPLKSYLEVSNKAVTLEHQRPYDTHTALELKPGVYEMRRQREWIPQGFQRVAD